MLADLAISATHGGDYDRADLLSRQPTRRALRTEASLTIDLL